MIPATRSVIIHILRWTPPLPLRLLVTLGGLALVGWVGASVDVVGAESWTLVGGAISVMLLATALNGLKWGFLARVFASDGRIPAMSSFIRVYFEAQTYSLLLPTGVGGDAYRTLFLARASDSPLGAPLASVVLDRMTGLLFLSVLATTAFIGARLLQVGDHVVAPMGAAIAIISALAVGYGARRVTDARLSQARSHHLFVALLLGATYTLVWLAGINLLARGLGISLQVTDTAVVTLIVAVALALPISVGGFGAREGAFVVALSSLGYSTDEGFRLAIAYTAVFFVHALVGATSIAISAAADTQRAIRQRRLTTAVDSTSRPRSPALNTDRRSGC